MSRVFIIGAAGKVGRRLAHQLVERGHQTVALHRNPEQSGELKAIGAVPVSGSLLELDASELAQCMAGSDVVIFSAGAGGKGGMEMKTSSVSRATSASRSAAW